MIVAADLNECGSDMANLIPVTEQFHINTNTNTNAAPAQLLAKAGYCRLGNLADTAAGCTEFFIAIGRTLA